jgi:hypothetical protein
MRVFECIYNYRYTYSKVLKVIVSVDVGSLRGELFLRKIENQIPQLKDKDREKGQGLAKDELASNCI